MNTPQNMGGPQGIRGLLRGQSDILLAVAVVAIVGMLVVRISPGMMDYVIALNISAGVTILLLALYIRDASKLPAFPTILLLTTLLRLAINVSTTRLILLEANAGDIIFAFGDFVVGGNFVVGGVVFLVLVLIQFIVIAKGSERVAEVGARFTLDAMPGKQMSIDNDLRNELITPEQARNRRQSLERESKLYGAMDGAMKFVKGDAIAGIVISLVNIVGGLIVGVMQQGMSVAEAAQLYALLTIGDGLVSQIPALLISVAAGLVVTRVASSDTDEKTQVASEIFDQVLAYPRALLIVAVLLFVLGISNPWTGFPVIPFLALSGIVLVLGVTGLKLDTQAQETQLSDAKTIDEAQEKAPGQVASGPMPIVLELGAGLESLFLDETGQELTEVRQVLDTDIRQFLTNRLGVAIPPINLRMDNPHLQDFEYGIVFFDGMVAHQALVVDKIIAMCGPQDAQNAGLEFQKATVPWSRAEICAIDQQARDSAEAAGIRTLTPFGVLVEHLRIILSRHAAEFAGVQETSDLIDQLRQRHPALVQSLVPGVVRVQQISEVLKSLLREQVPISDLRKILESIGRLAEQQKDLSQIAQGVCLDLNRQICGRLAVGRMINHYRLDYEITDLLANATVQTGDGVVLDLPPDDQKMILKAIETGVDPVRHLDQPLVFIVRSSLQSVVRNLIAPSLPDAAVLSDEQIAQSFIPKTLNHISFAAVEAQEATG